VDSLTHLALGACMGEAFAGNKLGRKAMIWGAVAQSAPDIDFIGSFFLDTPGDLIAHRGFTHSILFALMITPVMAYFAERWHRPHNISFLKWSLFFGVVILAHIFIDAFNNYGVGWWEPFSHDRMSFNSIYVADPFFSIPPALAIIAMIYLPKRSRYVKICWQWGLGLSALYLIYCLGNKYYIDTKVRSILADKKIAYTQYFTTPAPLQNWLWFIVAGNDQGFHVGFRSVFEDQPSTEFQYFPRNDSLLQDMDEEKELIQLKQFSQGFYTVEKWGDTLVFNDLRFGQIIGWQDPKEKFVFHYFLHQPGWNNLVVQRGRFKSWNWQVFKDFIRRIFRD